MTDPSSRWDWLAAQARQQPPEPGPAPAGFADRVLSRHAARRESRIQFRIAIVASIAAGVAALAFGLWCADAVAAGWERPPLAMENVLPGACAMILLRRWKLLLALVAVFAAGLAVGIAGTLRAVQKRIQEAQNPATWTPRTLTWLRTELRLTPEQEEKALPAVEEAVAELKNLRDDMDRGRRAIIGRMLFQVADHLDDAQRQLLRDIVSRARKNEMPQGGVIQ